MNNPSNFSLSTDWLHLANDDYVETGIITIPANQSLAANSRRQWTSVFTVNTRNGAFIVPSFEISLPALSGSKIYTYDMSVIYFTNIGNMNMSISISRINNTEWELKAELVNFYLSAQTMTNPEFTIKANLKTLVVL